MKNNTGHINIVGRVTQSLKDRAYSDSEVRRSVGLTCLGFWDNLLEEEPNTPTKDVLEKFSRFVNNQAESATNITERLNFIEILDIITREGEISS